MADGLVLSRRVSERGVHEMAQRAGCGPGAGLVHEYVGYEEWVGDGFLRRETAHAGVSLILAFGDSMTVYDGEAGTDLRELDAFVVGNQSHSSVTGVGGHQLGVQVDLTPGGALALLGDVAAYNDAVIPLDEALGADGVRLLDQLAAAPSWDSASLHPRRVVRRARRAGPLPRGVVAARAARVRSRSRPRRAPDG